MTTCADCGAAFPVNPPGYCGGTGYAWIRYPRRANAVTLPDGRTLPTTYTVDNEQAGQRAICYDCSAVVERDYMVARGRTCLYLCRTTDGYRLTDWPGRLSLPILGRVRESKGRGFGGTYPVQTFSFVGPDGYVWSGRCAGDMQLARCRRTKQRPR